MDGDELIADVVLHKHVGICMMHVSILNDSKLIYVIH